MKKEIRKIAALALLAVMGAVSYAETQGIVGSSSQGTFDLSIIIPKLIRISGLADVVFDPYSGSGSVTSNQDVCLYTNASGGLYSVTATGDGAGNAFTIKNLSAQTIAYSLAWNHVTGTAGAQALTSGVALTGQSTTERSSPVCSGGNTANIAVTMDEAALVAAEADTYSGVVTLMVSPQ